MKLLAHCFFLLLAPVLVGGCASVEEPARDADIMLYRKPELSDCLEAVDLLSRNFLASRTLAPHKNDLITVIRVNEIVNNTELNIDAEKLLDRFRQKLTEDNSVEVLRDRDGVADYRLETEIRQFAYRDEKNREVVYVFQIRVLRESSSLSVWSGQVRLRYLDTVPEAKW